MGHAQIPALSAKWGFSSLPNGTPPQYVVAIETSSRNGSICLGRNGVILEERRFSPGNRHAAELMVAGADAVQVGTATFRDPKAPWKVLRQLARWCDAHGTTVQGIRERVRARVGTVAGTGTVPVPSQHEGGRDG